MARFGWILAERQAIPDFHDDVDFSGRRADLERRSPAHAKIASALGHRATISTTNSHTTVELEKCNVIEALRRRSASDACGCLTFFVTLFIIGTCRYIKYSNWFMSESTLIMGSI